MTDLSRASPGDPPVLGCSWRPGQEPPLGAVCCQCWCSSSWRTWGSTGWFLQTKYLQLGGEWVLLPREVCMRVSSVSQSSLGSVGFFSSAVPPSSAQRSKSNVVLLLVLASSRDFSFLASCLCLSRVLSTCFFWIFPSLIFLVFILVTMGFSLCSGFRVLFLTGTGSGAPRQEERS